MSGSDRGRPALSTDDDRRAAGSEPEYETRANERLTAFSDAVVAIAITLLAIDLPVPAGRTTHEFWTQVSDNAGHYAAFLISFAVIASARGAHHDIFRYVRRTDARLRQYNTLWLLTIVLIPFATRLLTPAVAEARDIRALGFGFYALLQVLESGTLFVMMRHISSREQAPDFPRPLMESMSWRSRTLAVTFGLSIPVFFLTVDAWLIWILVPPLLGRVHHLRHRTQNRPRPK